METVFNLFLLWILISIPVSLLAARFLAMSNVEECDDTTNPNALPSKAKPPEPRKTYFEKQAEQLSGKIIDE